MAVGCALVLLLALGCARAGEFCHGWAGGARRWHRGFQCPERWDSPAATLCCGSCALRYCCASPAARLDQGHCPGPLPTPGPPAPVPGYLPFLLVGSVFVAFVVGGACVGICCCKCFKSRDEGQPGGLAAGQTWLLEAEVPCPPPSSAGGAPQSRGPRAGPAPPGPGLPAEPRFLPPAPCSAQLPHPSRAHHGIPTAHTALGAPLFLQRATHGHRAGAAPAGVAPGGPALFPAVPV